MRWRDVGEHCDGTGVPFELCTGFGITSVGAIGGAADDETKETLSVLGGC